MEEMPTQLGPDGCQGTNNSRPQTHTQTITVFTGADCAKIYLNPFWSVKRQQRLSWWWSFWHLWWRRKEIWNIIKTISRILIWTRGGVRRLEKLTADCLPIPQPGKLSKSKLTVINSKFSVRTNVFCLVLVFKFFRQRWPKWPRVFRGFYSVMTDCIQTGLDGNLCEQRGGQSNLPGRINHELGRFIWFSVKKIREKQQILTFRGCTQQYIYLINASNYKLALFFYQNCCLLSILETCLIFHLIKPLHFFSQNSKYSHFCTYCPLSPATLLSSCIFKWI